MSVADTEERCAVYGCTYRMPVRTPTTPPLRYCETHWWEEQRRRYGAREEVHPNAKSYLDREATP